MAIRFACACGQQLAVKDEYAGRKVRCTSCSQILSVPGGAPAAPAAAPPVARHAPAPPPPVARRPVDDDRDYDEEERPRRRKKKGGIPRAVIAGVAVLLLLGVGFLVWKLFFSGPSAAALAEFDLVPRDAEGFLTIRVADVLKTEAGKKVFEAARQNDKEGALKEMEAKAGITPQDIERLTFVAMSADKELWWMVIRTSKAVNRKGVIDGMKSAQERTHQGKKYHYSEAEHTGVYFISDQQMVFAPEPGMKKVLELPEKPPSGPLDEMIEMAAKNDHHVFGGGQVPANQRQAAQAQMGPFAESVKSLLEAKSAYLTADVKSKIELTIGIELPDKGKAEAAAKEIETLITMARGFLAFAPPELKPQAQDALNQLKPKQDGTRVSVGLSLESGPLVNALVKQIEMQGGGRREGGPQRPPRRPR